MRVYVGQHLYRIWRTSWTCHQQNAFKDILCYLATVLVSDSVLWQIWRIIIKVWVHFVHVCVQKPAESDRCEQWLCNISTTLKVQDLNASECCCCCCCWHLSFSRSMPVSVYFCLTHQSLCMQADRRLYWGLRYRPEKRIAKELRPDNRSVVCQPALANL